MTCLQSLSANKESTCFELGISTDTTLSGSHCGHSVHSVTSGLNLVMHLAHFPTCATEMLVKMQADRQTMLLVELSWCWSYLSEFFSLSSPRWFTRQLFDESFHNTLKLERWVPELNVPRSALVSNSLLKFLWQWGLDPGPHAYILKHCSPSSITIIY